MYYKLEPWKHRWFVFSDDGVGYMKHNSLESNELREFNYYPPNFKVNVDKKYIRLNYKYEIFDLYIDDQIHSVDIVNAIIDGFSNSCT